MGKYKKSQILILFLIALLLFVTPFLSSSIRSTHLYFIINILIVALGAEAGLLSASSVPPDQEKNPVSITTNKIITPLIHSRVKVVEKSGSEKITNDTDKITMEVKKCCSSTPSIFFISSGKIKGDEDFEDQDEEGEEEVGSVADEELSEKAETFISNFYKQLKMQREDS